MTTWSYSSIKTFEQCPKKYYHLRILKDVKDEGSEATVYGSEVHKAAEEHLRDNTPLPAKFKFLQTTLDALRAIGGERYCELKLGIKLTEDYYEPCGFFDADVWWRGVADLVIIKGNIAYSVDYKTSKSAKYADTKQLDAVAAGLFIKFPQLERIKSALCYVVSNEFIHKEHYVEQTNQYLRSFSPLLDRLNVAQETDVWNANSGPLCRYCPVVSCEHHRK